MNLTDFLLARIAEDESRVGMMDCQCPDEYQLANCADHVLRECEAKRRIAEAAALVGAFSRTAGDYTHGAIGAYGLAVRELAAVYSEHPDYDESWRP